MACKLVSFIISHRLSLPQDFLLYRFSANPYTSSGRHPVGRQQSVPKEPSVLAHHEILVARDALDAEVGVAVAALVALEDGPGQLPPAGDLEPLAVEALVPRHGLGLEVALPGGGVAQVDVARDGAVRRVERQGPGAVGAGGLVGVRVGVAIFLAGGGGSADEGRVAYPGGRGRVDGQPGGGTRGGPVGFVEVEGRVAALCVRGDLGPDDGGLLGVVEEGPEVDVEVARDGVEAAVRGEGEVGGDVAGLCLDGHGVVAGGEVARVGRCEGRLDRFLDDEVARHG